MTKTSLSELILERRRISPDRIARRVRETTGWRDITWREHLDDAIALAAAMRKRGIGPGQTIGIIGETSRDWELIDIAGVLNGSISVGIYASSTLDQMREIGGDADIRVFFVRDRARLAPLGPAVYGFDDLADWIAEGRRIVSADPERVPAIGRDVTRESVATIVYTSGTTGGAKGAVLTHGNLLAMVELLEQVVPGKPDDVGIGYLPFAHVLQRTALYRTFHTGTTIVYAPSIDRLVETAAETAPTNLAAVPRVLERIYERVREPLPPGWEENDAVRSQISARMKQMLGGRIGRIYCGSAPLAESICRFFHAIDIPVYEGYGLTEVSAVASLNTPDAFKIGSVGRPLPGVDIRIESDGEISIRGPGNFREYHRLPGDTKEAVRDGWFRTGDLGRFDEDGFLYITGRKKELIATSGGKKVAPGPIESALMSHPLVSQALVHGDRRKFLTALVTIAPEHGRALLEKSGLGELSPRHEIIVRAVQQHVDDVNGRLAPFEQIKRFAILDRELTIEAGELTPTLKIRRSAVENSYREVLDALYVSSR